VQGVRPSLRARGGSKLAQYPLITASLHVDLRGPAEGSTILRSPGPGGDIKPKEDSLLRLSWYFHV